MENSKVAFALVNTAAQMLEAAAALLAGIEHEEAETAREAIADLSELDLVSACMALSELCE